AAAILPHRVDFVFNLFNSIRHLASDAAMRAHFTEIARVLRPNGVYAVGLSFTAYGAEPPDEDVWEGRRGALHVHQVVQYLPPGAFGNATRRELVVSHLTVERGRRVEHIDDVYRLRCYDAAEGRGVVEHSALRPLATLTMGGEPARQRPAYAIELLAPS